MFLLWVHLGLAKIEKVIAELSESGDFEVLDDTYEVCRRASFRK
jgi:hypothetical protein